MPSYIFFLYSIIKLWGIEELDYGICYRSFLRIYAAVGENLQSSKNKEPYFQDKSTGVCVY